MTKDETRVWLRQIVEVIRKGCDLTETVVDDKACDMMLVAIDNDAIYGWMWKLIGGLLNNEPDVVGCEMPVSDVAAINPLMIIAIVKAIVALWQAFRK